MVESSKRKPLLDAKSYLPVLCFANKFSADSIRNPNQWLH